MLPNAVFAFLRRAAEGAGVPAPDADTLLFEAGILDSFALVELVALLEDACGVSVPDADLRPENFRSLARIEAFVLEKATA
jgi:acyl carrier protein